MIYLFFVDFPTKKKEHHHKNMVLFHHLPWLSHDFHDFPPFLPWKCPFTMGFSMISRGFFHHEMPSFEKPGRVSEVTGRLWERAQRSPLLQRCPSKLKAALGGKRWGMEKIAPFSTKNGQLFIWQCVKTLYPW